MFAAIVDLVLFIGLILGFAICISGSFVFGLRGDIERAIWLACLALVIERCIAHHIEQNLKNKEN